MADASPPAASPQRAYRALCPGCGAPVEFRSAQSTHAVCGFCQSTVVRSGEQLARIGKMAEVFDDYSPLQLYASGRWTDPQGRNRGFTVVGRLQYKTASGTWSDWPLVFDDGGTGSLGEDNGAFVLSLPLAPVAGQPPWPPAAQLRVGATTAVQGVLYQVAANQPAALMAAQGELPRLPALGEAFDVVELRNARGEVLSIEYLAQTPSVTLGREVQLDDLQLKGLRERSVREDKGRQFNCPACGAPVTVALDTSKAVTCGSCNSIIDLKAGIGGELAFARQHEPVQPLIALGRTGKLQGVDWQVVGFQHRTGKAPGDDEVFGWSEYLLYHTRRGFSFLVDSEEGWSQVRPTTGAPQVSRDQKSASYLGLTYGLKYTYRAETSYVAGEFYWPVSRGQVTSNMDYAKGKSLLSMEQAPGETTWSVGAQVDAAVVAKAFGLDDRTADFKRGDAAPTSSLGSMGCLTVVILCVVIFVLLLLLGRCSSCNPAVENCQSYSSGGSTRSSGGSYGGYSGGGGHK